jgi:two-component system CheB/CheR fusion protein
MPADRSAPNPAATRIVGIGASAGGLAALERFLASVPADSGLAYVVVQHLDPTHKAMLTELLQRVTAMPVREAVASMRVEPDAVYVIPPNTELTVVAGALNLALPSQRRGMRLPIDVLFASLARDQGERAIGVVLSGMGADGTLGLQAIKSLGGLALAQEPETAQFDAMPTSAIAAGCADIVAPPAELAQRIAQIAGARHPPSATMPSADEAGDLSAILDLLRDRSKHDLSQYKPTTLRRRIERRIGVHGLASMAAYAAFVLDNPAELDLLFKEMLIGVTGFFRDPLVWQELAATVLPALLARAGGGAHLRAWVVGCSTGEEAYSLAMLFKEAIGSASQTELPVLQIFATDISADAIAFARRGDYPASIAASVGSERLARFFSPQGDSFRVVKDIREMVLFAQQDVLLDPPFTRLDILCCRNLMIYFSAPLQRRLIPLFHYSLRPGGVLLLGGSETIGRSQAQFTPLDLKSRIYRRSEAGVGAGPVEFPVQRRKPSRNSTQESTVSMPTRPPGNLQALADQLVLQEFAPAAVLLSQQGDIVYISGRTGKYLEPAAGKANWNIHVMARPGLRSQLAAALRKLMQAPGVIELQGLKIDDDPQRPVDVSVRSIQAPQALAGMVMVVFRDAVAPQGRSSRRRSATGAADPASAEELARSLAEVQALREEMRASEEELQAANEELQSTNEELQSANEELTTSKEEAQSMNEELQTINAELQSKLDDLALAQSDMQNLLNSMDIATLFLDNDLNVRRFTEQMTHIVHLRDTDVGRPLSELASTLNYPELHADARETLRTLAFAEKEAVTTDDRWYSVRIMPYRTLANVIRGVVITFVDITATKLLEARLRNG